MDNIGQLLHKLTKYQTLYGSVTNESKRLIYNQKINHYKQQLEKAGIDQNNINGVQNLVGGAFYKTDADNILAGLVKTQKSSEKEQTKKTTDINQKIINANVIINKIKKNYDNTIETIKYIIKNIEEKISNRGSAPASDVLPGILKQIKQLETTLTDLQTHTLQFKKNMNIKSSSQLENLQGESNV